MDLIKFLHKLWMYKGDIIWDLRSIR
jgi:hypothetical protein